MDFLVGEAFDRTVRQGKMQVVGDGFGKGTVGVTGHQLHERDPDQGAFGSRSSVAAAPLAICARNHNQALHRWQDEGFEG
ncbi:hypothetical protein D9M72_485030 [compost metagenome]